MQPREQRIYTPLTFAHRVVLAATERGQLQDLIFDRRNQWSHRTLATIFGAIYAMRSVSSNKVEVLEKEGYQGLFAVEIDYMHPSFGEDTDKAVSDSIDYLKTLK